VDTDELRRQNRESWDAMAPGWERARDERETTVAPVREWLIRELAPEPGDTVLELASGQGDTGFEVAPLLGESGRLISSDFSSAMVEIARRRAGELGLGNVEHRVIDAERMELEDDSVDGVLCRYGYMLMPDPAAALSETRRVLRPGGRLAFAVWSSAERNPWISLAGRMFVARGHFPPPEPSAPGMFAMASEEHTRSLLENAGFADVRMEEVPVRFTVPDVDEYVRRSADTGGMFSKAWGAASEDERDAMKDELRDAFAPFAVDGGYEIPGVALCVLAS
jgi:ubiquinone/menaquinone biosynthesis C-methylase UbiE